jgi:hypothetical protein
MKGAFYGDVVATRIPISGKVTFLDFVVPAWIVPNKIVGYTATKH